MKKVQFFSTPEGWLFFTGDYFSPVYSTREICAGAYLLWRQLRAIDSVDPL
jgi:hypothetical protein